MTSRDQILNSIKSFQNTKALEIETNFETNPDKLNEFIHNATLAGAVVKTEDANCIDQSIEELVKQKPDNFIYVSSLGVSENGALWCQNLGSDREKLFMCNDLIIKIKASDIVSNMHQAYEKVDLSNAEFGTFIAGPSKTADIEQSLVIGAHGAMSLNIFIELD